MSLLLLDPLVLVLLACLVAYGWLVWSGRFHSWFRPDRLWLGFWPLPAILLVVPLLVGPLLRAAGLFGPEDGAGGIVAVLAYVAVNGVPMLVLGLAPPRWLLPPWARARLATLPDPDDAPVPGAVPAAHATGTGGSVGWPRWRWRIDAEPGHCWVDGSHLRFRAVSDPGTEPVSGLDDFDQADIDQLELRWGEQARLEPPKGGWWRRRQLDVDLDALDGWHVGVRRPWSPAGLLVLEVEGRRPLRLWVAHARDLADALETIAPTASDEAAR